MRALLAAISVREIRHMVYVLAGLDLRSGRDATVLGTPSDPRRSTDGRLACKAAASLLQESAQSFFLA